MNKYTNLFYCYYMKIDPAYLSVGVLFKRQSTFFITNNQRAYAWNSECVSDLIND